MLQFEEESLLNKLLLNETFSFYCIGKIMDDFHTTFYVVTCARVRNIGPRMCCMYWCASIINFVPNHYYYYPFIYMYLRRVITTYGFTN